LGDSVKAKGIRFISNDVALDANHFDVVLCHHVLEHVSRPLASLQRIKELLRTGGKLLLFVPFERESRFRRYRADNRAHHLYSWTKASLEKLVSTAGFEILSMELQKFRFDRAAAIIAKRLFGGLRLYRFLRSTGMVLARNMRSQWLPQRLNVELSDTNMWGFCYCNERSLGYRNN
jgi:SAM-dependent methyltransferase